MNQNRKYLTAVLRRVKRAADERGATAVEYGLMVALISAMVAAAVVGMGSAVLASFTLMTDLWP